MTGLSPVGGSATAGFGSSPYLPPDPRGTAGEGRDRRGAARSWHQALDDLEGDVLDAQELLARDRAEEIANWGRRSEDWIPPQGLGPVPPDLRERAARLLQHQLAVADQLAEGTLQSRRQRDVPARISYAPAGRVASYIDRGL